MFWGKKNRSSEIRWSDSESRLAAVKLANLSAEQLTVALHTDLAAAQQIGHCGDCFLTIFGARTNRENEVTE